METANRNQNRNQQNTNRADPRPKKCAFCENKTTQTRPNPRIKKGAFWGREALKMDYKDYPTLKPFIDYFGNIRKRYYTGVCLKHQKMLKTAVERARFMAMLAYRK